VELADATPRASDPGEAPDDAAADAVAAAVQTTVKLVRRNRKRRTAPPPHHEYQNARSVRVASTVVSTARNQTP
jgi:hypothetical protein